MTDAVKQVNTENSKLKIYQVWDYAVLIVRIMPLSYINQFSHRLVDGEIDAVLVYYEGYDRYPVYKNRDVGILKTRKGLEVLFKREVSEEEYQSILNFMPAEASEEKAIESIKEWAEDTILHDSELMTRFD